MAGSFRTSNKQKRVSKFFVLLKEVKIITQKDLFGIYLQIILLGN